MRKILLLITAIMIVLIACKDAVPEKTTTLFQFTPFYRAPTILKGQVKSYQWRTYWTKEVDGKIEKGEIITRTERDSLGLMSDFNLKINEAGIVTRLEWITYEGEINHHDYDIQENRIVKGTWHVLGEPRNYRNVIYDEMGNNIEVNWYRVGVDTLMSRSTATYFENGNLKERLSYNFKGELTTKQLFIWKDENLLSEYQSYNSEGELNYTQKVGYDENGEFIQLIYDGPNRERNQYDYKDRGVDDMGNFIYAVSYNNDELFAVFEIQIEYY